MKTQQRQLRHRRIRAKISGTALMPRLNVFRSLNHIYAQLIDDTTGRTLASASTKEFKSKGKKLDEASEVGKKIAAKAKEAGINKVAFDRGGFKYHGRIKSLAEAARTAGLEF